MKTQLIRLFGHLEWADEQVLESLRRCAKLPSDALNVYAHIVAAEHVWLTRILGVPQRIAIWPEFSIDDCARLARENAEGFESLIADATIERFAEAITYHNSAGSEFTTLLEDILLHVAMHGSYHRGQIATALRRSGNVPNPTDYIAFVRGAPAAARVPARG